MYQAFNLYEKKQLPIKYLANYLNTNEANLILTFINDSKQSIYCSIDNNMRNGQIIIKKINKNKPIIISTETLILIKILGIETLIFNNFNVGITAITRSELEKLVNDMNPPEKQKMVRNSSGDPVIITVENHIVKYLEYLKCCINGIKIINFKSKLSNAQDIIKFSEKIPYENIFKDTIVAKQNNCYICSSDFMTQIVNKSFSLVDISIYDLIFYLKDNKIISETEFLNIKYKLISINYKYLSISINEILAFMIDKNKSFNVVLDYFDSLYTKDSLANVFALFIQYQVENEAIYEHINLIFAKFKKLDYSNKIIYLFMKNLNGIFYKFSDNVQKTFLYNISEISKSQREHISFLENIIEQINHIQQNEKRQYEIKRLIDNSDIRIRETLKNIINNPKNEL